MLIIISLIVASTVTFLFTDFDNDNLSNLFEMQHGTKITNYDTDGDSLSDEDEIMKYETNPLKKDTDEDGINDNFELNRYSSDPLDEDSDNDGLIDGNEIDLGTSINDEDSDNDGIKDGNDENPTTHEWKLMDSDNDGWNDYKEYYETETDRYDSDTDGDGVIDSKDENPLSSAKVFTRTFEWDYPHDWWNQQTWTWTLQIPKDLYNYLENLPRINQASWSEYTVDPIITNLANGLKDAAEAENYDDYQTVSFILSFVQSLQYTSDDVTTSYDEYPRYPTETLVYGGGDCEDTSFLFAGIIRELNFGACLIIPPGHVAVGVSGDENIAGTYYELDGKRYYYCETTGDGWVIGDCPDEYIDESAQLIRLN